MKIIFIKTFTATRTFNIIHQFFEKFVRTYITEQMSTIWAYYLLLFIFYLNRKKVRKHIRRNKDNYKNKTIIVQGSLLLWSNQNKSNNQKYLHHSLQHRFYFVIRHAHPCVCSSSSDPLIYPQFLNSSISYFASSLPLISPFTVP